MDAKTRCTYSNIIWILLDEDDKSHKIQCSSALINEIFDIQSSVVNKIKEFYIYQSNTLFERTQELQENAIKIAEILQEYWKSLLKHFDLQSIKQEKTLQKIIGKFPKIDQNFINSVIHTQMFINSLDN